VPRAATDRPRASPIGLASRKRRRGIRSGPIGRMLASWASLPCGPLHRPEKRSIGAEKTWKNFSGCWLARLFGRGEFAQERNKPHPRIIPSGACWLCCYLNANLIGRDNRPFGRNHHTGRYRIGQSLATTFEA
jgi:hypothetical protein